MDGFLYRKYIEFHPLLGAEHQLNLILMTHCMDYK